jgi:hypothetical protein
MEPFVSQPHAGHIPGQRPFISVAIPTFGRPDTVRRLTTACCVRTFATGNWWSVTMKDLREGP